MVLLSLQTAKSDAYTQLPNRLTLLCFQYLYHLYKTTKMLIYDAVIYSKKSDFSSAKHECVASSVCSCPVWLSLSFHPVADKVNVDNEQHQGTAHMPHFLDGNLHCVQVQEAKRVGYAIEVCYY